LEQFLASVAKDLRKCAIDAQESPGDIDMGHADGSLVKGGFEVTVERTLRLLDAF
jgi:hypothetical protein